MKNAYQHGFTLVEVLVAAFIFAVITALVSGFAVYYFQSYQFSFEENQQISQTQNAFTTIIREVRETRPAENGAYPIAQADDATLVFYADVTNDGRADRVRYFLNGTLLQKGVIEPTAAPVEYPSANEKITTITDSVNLNGKPFFTYYNGSWPADTINNPLPLSQRLLNTRLITVYIRINIQNNYSAQPFDLSESVAIRSLKDNL